MPDLFSATPKQKEFVEAVFSWKYHSLLFGGGVGGGKSFATFGTMLMLLKVFPGSKGICVRDTYPNLKLTSIASWKELIMEDEVGIGPGHFITEYNATEQIYYCANGSTLQFIAEDFQGKRDMQHFRGLQINFAILDEADTLQEQTYVKLIERCGRHLPSNGSHPPPILMLTCNPNNGWVKDTFYTPWKNGTLPLDRYFLPALIVDNPYLTANKNYIEKTKKNTPPYLYARQFEGNWEVEEPSEGRIYRCFDYDKHVASLVYNPELPLNISIDENCNPFMTMTVYQVVIDKDGTRNINLIREILGRNPLNTAEGICTLFKQAFPFHRAGINIFGDATSRKADTKIESGHNLYTLIEGHLSSYKPLHNRVPKSNPSVMLRCAFADVIFANEFNKIRFRVDKDAHESIADLMKTKVAEDGTKFKNIVRDPKTKVGYQERSHTSDSFDYFLCSMFARDFLEYQNGGRPLHAPRWGKNTPSTKFTY